MSAVHIGDHTLRNAILLAPMAGVTDLPFRRLVWAFGAGCVAGEMLSPKSELRDTVKSRLRREQDPLISPRVVQLAGNDTQVLAEAARWHQELGAQIIDLNFGCPAKKVCRKAAGSALLQNEPLVAALAAAVVDAVEVPVTVKMRTGFAPDQKNAPSIAQRLQDVGIAALTVHGRTRACGFAGRAEMDTVAEIKSKLTIPVFANGDISSREQAQEVMNQTQVDGVMIGRAALGAPWLLGRVAGELDAEPSMTIKLQTIERHIRALHEFYPDTMGLRIARKHLGWYLEKLKWPKTLTRQFNRIEDPQAQLDFVSGLALCSQVHPQNTTDTEIS